MQEILASLGWVCVKCSCPGSKGWDCMHTKHRGYMIKIRENFRIFQNGLVVDSGFQYQLKEKMKKYGIIE